ncbi:tautomerase family protein [Streptomyces guryensis]|uniref:tautomerase family protein n=1 Tax=Streptomyces guryensis TaxID=2886947 RepID=UPI0035569596
MVVQIFTQAGRSTAIKQQLCAAIADSLSRVGVAGQDVFIRYVENTPSAWSFGFGHASTWRATWESPLRRPLPEVARTVRPRCATATATGVSCAWPFGGN